MAKSNVTAVQKISAPAGLAVPDYLQDKAIVGTEDLKQFVVLPRLKIIQKSAGTELRAAFGTGDLVLSPVQAMLAPIGRDAKGNPDPTGPSIFFCPLFFYVDWATWNPIELKGVEPAIKYRTSDPNDPIVAKSRDAQLRSEPLLDASGKQRQANGKLLNMRHVEHLNFVVRLLDHAITDPFIMTFARGEHFSGRKFAGLVRMRKTSLFNCVFEAHATYRQGGQYDWYGIDIGNPPEASGISPWVTEQSSAEHQKLYDEFAGIFKTQGLRADLTDADDLQASGDGASSPHIETDPNKREM